MTVEPSSEITATPNSSTGLDSVLRSMADEFEMTLTPDVQQKLDAQLVDQCDFLNRTFQRFSAHIDKGGYTYIPTSSYEYAFLAMSHYRASYAALHKVNAHRAKKEHKKKDDK